MANRHAPSNEEDDTVLDQEEAEDVYMSPAEVEDYAASVLLEPELETDNI